MPTNDFNNLDDIFEKEDINSKNTSDNNLVNSQKSEEDLTKELLLRAENQKNEKSSKKTLDKNTDKNPEENLDQKMQELITELTPTSLEDRVEIKVLEEEMQKSYLSYAMSVIMSRALPDVRDGMKPVHRRIIYVLNKMGLTPGSKYRKCAQVVGEVLGKYHPHGDASVYNALARLAQDFSVRYPLIDGQGNFGSIDGDPPAAMRYTECRMAKPSTYLVGDIEKDTVDFVDNYDGSFREPKVLPVLLPNLLINGQTGIAVGMATEIPPHNLNEVCNALLYLIRGIKPNLDSKTLENEATLEEDNQKSQPENFAKSIEEITIEELMEFIKGPDLPTGGIIYGKSDILNAYKTGRGRCLVRSKTYLTENSIVITEIPFQINKANLLIKIADLVKEKRIEGIKDIRDESSNKEGLRIYIETKKDVSPEVILNQLFQLTELQVWQHFNLLALIKDGRQPKLLNLKEILVEFINHRYVVVTRRTKFDLNKAEAELHILDGLKIALDAIDRVIDIIRSSYDKTEASENLQKEFNLSQKQTEAILQIRLQTLTNLDRNKIENDRQERIALIKDLKDILENPERMKNVICDEISDLSEKLKSPRKTQIIEPSLGDYKKEDLIEQEDVLVQLTQSQYVKVLPIDSFKVQARGGRGVISFNPKDQDWVKSSFVCNTHDYVYAFTNTGRVFRTRVFELPLGARQGRGQSLVNYFEFQENEKISTILTISKEQEKDQRGSLIFATKKGLVKRTNLDLFERINRSGKIALGLNEEDELLDVKLSLDDKDKLVLSASNGKTVIFGREQLNPLGRTAKGVRGIKIKPKFELISLQISNLELIEGEETEEETALIESESKEKEYPSILVITENGFGKQTKLADFRMPNRAAGGVKTLKMTEKTGKPILVSILYGDEENLIITTKKGITIRIDPTNISQFSRNTQGVKIIKLEKKDFVVSGDVN
jgi:DNA gyrase subunit A